MAQHGLIPAQAAVAQKDVNEIDDRTLILVDVGRKAQAQVRAAVTKLLSRHLPEARAVKAAHSWASTPSLEEGAPPVEYIPAPYDGPQRPSPSRQGPFSERPSRRRRA